MRERVRYARRRVCGVRGAEEGRPRISWGVVEVKISGFVSTV